MNTSKKTILDNINKARRKVGILEKLLIGITNHDHDGLVITTAELSGILIDISVGIEFMDVEEPECDVCDDSKVCQFCENGFFLGKICTDCNSSAKCIECPDEETE